MDLPSSDQASSEGLSLIPIVGNNTERGAESVLVKSIDFSFHTLIYIRYFNEGNSHVHATIFKATSVYPANLLFS